MHVTRSSFEFVRALVAGEAGIVIEPGKEYLVEARLLPLARVVGVPDVDTLVTLMKHPRALPIRQRAVWAMTTNETSFFRDVAPFDALRQVVLPAVIEARRAERRLAIWSAASSTGQEPYSIAMVIHEHFRELLSWDLTLVASDLSTVVLERARQGKYNQIEVNRGLPAAYLVKYFDQRGLDWFVKPEIRDMVRFEQINLHRAWPAFPPLDVVMLRNVMIYFDVDARRQILGRVRQVLRPDGYLFLGAAETTLHLDDRFERLAFERSGCHRNAASTVDAR